MPASCPDIDTTKSFVGKIFKPVSKLIEDKYSHRSITHSLSILLVITGLSLMLSIPEFIIGYSSHLLLDLLTPMGLRFFYPKKDWYVLFGAPLKTGKHDNIITILTLAGLMFT